MRFWKIKYKTLRFQRNHLISLMCEWIMPSQVPQPQISWKIWLSSAPLVLTAFVRRCIELHLLATMWQVFYILNIAICIGCIEMHTIAYYCIVMQDLWVYSQFGLLRLSTRCAWASHQIFCVMSSYANLMISVLLLLLLLIFYVMANW